MDPAELEVRLFDRSAGHLRRDREGELTFTYDPAWVADRLPPISQSLPVGDDSFRDRLTRAFFGNLLPEGAVRDVIAVRLGVSPEDEFALLAAIGRDCAGALVIVPSGGDPFGRAPGVDWLTEEQLGLAIVELPRDPLRFDPDEDIRISLAGAQDKLAVVAEDGRVGLPVGEQASTHIVKASLERFESTPSNEVFCLALARSLGLEAPPAEVHQVGAHEVLMIERYDRRRGNGRIERVHQEDFCQALGISARAKYEEHGGPGIADTVQLLRRACDQPAAEVLRFLDAVFLNLLIGNHDAHGKNFSLLYSRSRPFVRMAPLYDLLCTPIYGIGRTLPMRIGRERRPERVGATAVGQLAAEAGVGAAQLRARARLVAVKAPNAARAVTRSAAELGIDASIAERIEAVVNRRAVDLHRNLGPP